MYGYLGKLLFIDLTDQSVEVRDLDEKMARDYLGGPALGARILYDEMPANTPWDAPESVLGFVRGPLNGASAFFGSRWTVVSKSPVYNGWNDANGGGFFGPTFTAAGYDGVFIRGISEAPVYIFIDNGKVEFRDATHLWGLTTMPTEAAIREELGDPNVQVALIGPAGERLSHMAAVMNDSHRAAGRGGSGAVMGSKRLKALVVRGSQHVEMADRSILDRIGRTTVEDMKGSKANIMANRGRFGTAGGAMGNVLANNGSIKNWAGASHTDFTEEQAEALNASALDEGRRVRKYACAACPLGCGAIYEVKGREVPDMEHAARPEYEAIPGFTSMMQHNDVDRMIYCNHLCNEYGFDTISFCGTVAWAMECLSDGVLKPEDLDGIDLRWGNAKAMVEVSERICRDEGNCAALLKNGSQYAADSIKAGHYALFCASGIELAQHDPRLACGLGRTYQYEPTPGRHVKGGRGLAIRLGPDEIKYNCRMIGFDEVTEVSKREIVNASGYCMSYTYLMGADLMKNVIEAVTGFHYTAMEFRMLGVRSFIMRLCFGARDGLRRSDYTISPRCISEPKITTGRLAGIVLDIESYADGFMDAIGCTPDFIPKKELLKLLEMEFVIPDLYPD